MVCQNFFTLLNLMINLPYSFVFTTNKLFVLFLFSFDQKGTKKNGMVIEDSDESGE